MKSVHLKIVRQFGVTYGRVNIQKFSYDQSRECNCNNVDERIVEEHDSSKHDDRCLIDRLPEPNQECFKRETSTFL